MTSPQWGRVQEGHLPRGLGRQTCWTSQEASSAVKITGLIRKKDNESENESRAYKEIEEGMQQLASKNQSGRWNLLEKY